jgi:hypothetical protein
VGSDSDSRDSDRQIRQTDFVNFSGGAQKKGLTIKAFPRPSQPEYQGISWMRRSKNGLLATAAMIAVLVHPSTAFLSPPLRVLTPQRRVHTCSPEHMPALRTLGDAQGLLPMRMSPSGPSGESNRPDVAEKDSELEKGIAEKGVKQMSTGEDDDDFAKLDTTQRKFKAASLRKEAVDLDEAAVELHEQAFAMEKRAAKLRIRAWKLEGAVSAVSKEVIEQNLKDKHEKTLAELDLMAEDWSGDPVCV